MGCFVRGGKNGMGCYVRGAKTAWDVMSRVTKHHGMFCPGWQIFAGCFVRGGKKWHGICFVRDILSGSHAIMQWKSKLTILSKNLVNVLKFQTLKHSSKEAV